MKAYSLHIASSVSEQTEISELRIEAYQKAFGTSLKSFEFLKWDRDDDRGLVMYLRDATGQAVASLRAVWLSHKTELETLFDIRYAGEIPTPILALDKLVILPHHRKKGLSSIFRYYVYRSGIGSDAACMTFTINEGASRISMQQKLGYQFGEADTSHRTHSPYQNEGGILLGVLPWEVYPQAVQVTEENLIVDMDSVELEEGFLAKLHDYLLVESHIQS